MGSIYTLFIAIGLKRCKRVKHCKRCYLSYHSIQPMNLYILLELIMIEPMAQENGMVAVVKILVDEPDLMDRIEHFWMRFYELRISGRGKIRKKLVPFKDGKVLIKAWGRRPETEVM